MPYLSLAKQICLTLSYFLFSKHFELALLQLYPLPMSSHHLPSPISGRGNAASILDLALDPTLCNDRYPFIPICLYSCVLFMSPLCVDRPHFTQTLVDVLLPRILPVIMLLYWTLFLVSIYICYGWFTRSNVVFESFSKSWPFFTWDIGQWVTGFTCLLFWKHWGAYWMPGMILATGRWTWARHSFL